MKLRIKYAEDPGRVHRVGASDDWTVTDLRRAVVGILGTACQQAWFSLNKKDALGPDDASLRSLGIRSGDTLWALLPVAAAGAAGTAASTDHQTGSANGTAAAAAAAAAVDQVGVAGQQQPCQQTAPPSQQHTTGQAAVPMEVDPSVAASQSPLPVAPTDTSTGTPSALQPADTQQLRVPGGELEQERALAAVAALPAHLVRLLASMQQQVEGTQWLLLAVHAAMLESGFIAASPSPGAVDVAPASDDAHLLYQYPMGGQQHTSSSSSCRGRAPAASAACSVRFLQLGSHVVLVAAAQPPPLEGSDAAAAGTPSTGASSSPAAQVVATLTLQPGAFLRPTAAAAAATSDGAAAGPACMAALEAGSPTPVAIASVPGAAGAAVAAYEDLPGLWVCLKDQLCLPLLAGVCRLWGQSPPWGLAVLPTEVLELVLSKLPAKELAQVCCVSAALCTAAAADALWQPLFSAEFTAASSAAAFNAPRLGYKWAFAAEWRQRLERQRAARARMHVPPGPPFPGIMPWGPARPRHPMQPPHIIGGDYDRLPQPLWGSAPQGAPFLGGGMSSGPMGWARGGGGEGPGGAPGWMAGGLGAAGLPSGFVGGLRPGRSGARDWRLP